MKTKVNRNDERPTTKRERVAMNSFNQGMQTQALIDEQTRPSWQEVNRLREENERLREKNERLLKEYNQLIKEIGGMLKKP